MSYRCRNATEAQIRVHRFTARMMKGAISCWDVAETFKTEADYQRFLKAYLEMAEWHEATADFLSGENGGPAR